MADSSVFAPPYPSTTHTHHPGVRESLFHPERSLPLIFQAGDEELDPVEWLKSNKALVEGKLRRHGAVLLRGFAASSVSTFEQCAEVLCSDLFTEYGDLPREKAGGKVYESTPYPADRSILFHHEASHTHRWPMKQWFYCVQPAREGGCTPLADGRSVLGKLAPGVREQFERKGLKYVRNFIEGLDVSWQDFFKSNDRRAVEESCRLVNIECEWSGDTLRTSRTCPAFARHPQTREMVFFNQILLHHVACLPSNLRNSLLTLYPVTELPRNVYFGDGSKIPDEIMQEVEQIYERVAVRFPWQKHDIVLVDNMLVAHARDPFVGDRKILVAMGEMVKFADVAAA